MTGISGPVDPRHSGAGIKSPRLGSRQASAFLASVTSAFALAACDEPIVDRSAIPKGIRVESLIFHHTEWFECAAAVYRLDPQFADQVRQTGLEALPRQRGGEWHATPAETEANDDTKEAANRDQTWACLEQSQDLAGLFDRYVHGGGAFFIENKWAGTSIVAPKEGLLFVGGYE